MMVAVAVEGKPNRQDRHKSLAPEIEAVSDHQQVVDHPFRPRPVRTNVKVTDRAELGSPWRRDVDGLAYEGLDIRRRVANVGRYAPAEHSMFSGRHRFPESRVVG